MPQRDSGILAHLSHVDSSGRQRMEPLLSSITYKSMGTCSPMLTSLTHSSPGFKLWPALPATSGISTLTEPPAALTVAASPPAPLAARGLRAAPSLSDA